MYCPICGSEMEVIEDEFSRIKEYEYGFDWATATKEEVDIYLDSEPDDASTHLRCTGERNCFDKGYPLIWHYPFDGREGPENTPREKRAPVDSWSLTWIK